MAFHVSPWEVQQPQTVLNAFRKPPWMRVTQAMHGTIENWSNQSLLPYRTPIEIAMKHLKT